MPIKGKSFEEIVKTEMDAGKSQAQALAIAYKEHPEKENSLSAMERFDSMQNRAKRGTERYASKKENERIKIKEGYDLEIKEDPKGGFTGMLFKEGKEYTGVGFWESRQEVREEALREAKEDSRTNEIKREDQNFQNEDDNIEGRTRIDEPKPAMNEFASDKSPGMHNEDEASQEEHEIQEDELLKKQEGQIRGSKKNSFVTVKEMKVQRKNSDTVSLKVQKTSKDIWSLVGVHQKHGGNGAGAILFKTRDEAINKGRELEKETKGEPRPYKLESIENSTVIVRTIK